MVARRKPATRVTALKPWEPCYVAAFGMVDGWTPPTQIKVVKGRTGGTMTALFRDERGDKIEGYIRFKAVGGDWKVTESGLRMVFKFKMKGGAK